MDRDLVDEYFTGTSPSSAASGSTRSPRRSSSVTAGPTRRIPTERVHRRLEVGGEYEFRRDGELHLFTPETVFLLQHATRTGRHEVFRQYTDEVNRLARDGGALRGLFEFRSRRRARRCRSTRWNRSSRSSPGSTPAR